jgi:hypothetical protein
MGSRSRVGTTNAFQHRRGSIPRRIISVGVDDSTFTNLHKPLPPLSQEGLPAGGRIVRTG